MAEVGSNVAAFLGKLWRMVEDPETNELISWSENGQSFLIRNQSKFAKELLPRYYKHNNMASFIRQLNMYGFHKIVSPDSGGLKTTTNDEVEFSHIYFIRGHLYMLEHIKRKITKDQNLRESNLSRTDVVNKIMYDVKNMKGRQESFDSKLSSMKQENEALWRELSILRQKHMKQQQIVNKTEYLLENALSMGSKTEDDGLTLINFLVSLVQPSRNGLSVKKINLPMIKGRREHTESFCSDDSNFESNAMMPSDRVQLMMGLEDDNSPPGPIIHELDSTDFLGDIEILQSPDTMLPSPLTQVEENTPPADKGSSKVDVNLLSSNTENNPLLLDLVKDVITEEETLVSLPPEQILPLAMKGERVNTTSTADVASTATNVKRARGKRLTGTEPTLATSLGNVFEGATKGKQEVRKRPHQSSGSKNGKSMYSSFPVSSKTNAFLNLTGPSAMDGLSNGPMSNVPSGMNRPATTELNQATSTEEFIDVNLIKEESHPSPSEGVQDGFDDVSPPHPLTFDPLNCFAESPSPSELDLHCNLSSSPPDPPSDNQCVMYKSPESLSMEGVIGRSESNFFRPPREQFDSHVDSIQNDLESLKDLMKGEGISLDASTLLNLFESAEPMLPQFKSDDRKSFPGDSSDNIADNKITTPTYAPSIDFSDMFSTSGLQSGESSPQPWLPSPLEVNTPMGALDSPVPNKRRKK